MFELRLNLALTETTLNPLEPDNDIEKSSIALEFDIDRLKTKINCPSGFCGHVFICIFFTRTAVLAATARQRRTTAQPGTWRV